MENTFSDLISGQGFERHFNHHFMELPDQGVDYRPRLLRTGQHPLSEN